jgi:hypothetical protein
MIPQSIVVVKAQPDLHSFRQREKTQGREAFDGGTVPGNLAIIPGELVFARRDCRNTSGAYGRVTQCVFSSFSGITTDDKNADQLTRGIEFVGVAQNEYMYGGDNLFGTEPLDHGLGVVFSGTFTVTNTGSTDINANDKLCFKVPAFPRGEPRSQGNNGPLGLDNGLNPLRRIDNRIGVPQGKVLPEIERFDPCNFAMPVAGSFELIGLRKAQGGISDVTPTEFFERNNDPRRDLTSAQEEAYGAAWTILTIASVANPGVDYGLSTGVMTDAGRELLKNVYGRNVFPGSNPGKEGNRKGSLNGSADDRRKYFIDHVFDLMYGSVGGAIAAKNATIIGTALGSAKPNKSLDMAIRY